MGPGSQREKVLQPGLSAELKITVGEAETAAILGSGSISVYATPALVALMENAAVRALEGHLPPGHTSVGIQIDVRHLGFRIEAWDEVERVGEASHVRFVVNEEAFMTKVNAKGK
jgi:predicted thioesterase